MRICLAPPSATAHQPPGLRGRPGASPLPGPWREGPLPAPSPCSLARSLAQALLGSGPGALHAHVGTCGPPRAGRVLISPLSWEFLLKTKQTKKVLVLLGFLPAAKWVLPWLPGPLVQEGPPPTRGVYIAMVGLCPVSRLPCPSPWSARGWPRRVPQLCRVSCGRGAFRSRGKLPNRWAPHGTQSPSTEQTGQKSLPPPGGAGGGTPGKQDPRREQRPPGQRHCHPVPLGRRDILPGTRTTKCH